MGNRRAEERAVGNYFAGIASSLTFGVSDLAIEGISYAIWHKKADIDENSSAYKAGVVTETVGEFAVFGASEGLKLLAKRAIQKQLKKMLEEKLLKEGEKDIYTKATNNLMSITRKEANVIQKANKEALIKKLKARGVENPKVDVQHSWTLRGHPGGQKGRRGGRLSEFPSIGLSKSIHNSKLLARPVERAKHFAQHKFQTRLEDAYIANRKYSPVRFLYASTRYTDQANAPYRIMHRNDPRPANSLQRSRQPFVHPHHAPVHSSTPVTHHRRAAISAPSAAHAARLAEAAKRPVIHNIIIDGKVAHQITSHFSDAVLQVLNGELATSLRA